MMLELTNGGRCVSGEDAVTFFESVPDLLDDAVKTEVFRINYERALNRLRYEVRKSVPIAPKIQKQRFTSYSCGQCGGGLEPGVDNYCPHCGRKIVDWTKIFTGSVKCKEAT